MISKLKKIVDELSIKENLEEIPKHVWGFKNQRERLNQVCELALQSYDGDILEIGAHAGLTTKIFCELAKKYNKKVVVLDPWNGEQQGNAKVYDSFKKNTKEYSDILETNKVSSFSKEGKNIIQNNKFAFCWIDGLHTYEACGQDIDSCSIHEGILAVDDLSWLPDLKNLFYEKQKKFNFQHYYNDNCREGYYITKQ